MCLAYIVGFFTDRGAAIVQCEVTCVSAVVRSYKALLRRLYHCMHMQSEGYILSALTRGRVPCPCLAWKTLGFKSMSL